MRSLLFLCLAALLPAGLRRRQNPRIRKPITVVELDRKDAVSYEKDIEPILDQQVLHSATAATSRKASSTWAPTRR